MGIRDLIAWTKKTHPSVITKYPKRWAAPQIRGKRIAIDGTLLTNRFHFAIQDGPLKGKGGLVGWFNLISILRKHNIKPVAIWDERGVREWKAPEATKRLAKRAMNISRRNHENERMERLTAWREAVQELENLSEDERSAVRSYFANTSIPPPRTRTSIQEKLEATTDLGVDDMESALDRVTALIDDLSTLKTAYETRSDKSYKKSPPRSDDIAEALQHVSELERLYETVGEPSRPKDILRSPPEEEEETSVLDEKLEEVIPDEAFTESRRQKALTDEEGRIIDEILLQEPSTTDTATTSIAQEAQGLTEEDNGDLPEPTSSEGEIGDDDSWRDDRPALERLDGLMQATPIVRQLYERALAMPSPSDHDACMELVTRMGVPVIKASIPYEAEGLAASMAKAGLVDFVGTEDSDVIAYEAPLLRNMSSSKEPLTLISSQRLRETTTLSPSAFLDFCILLGTDASPRIPNVGPARAFKLILKYGSIESILAEEPNVKARLPDIDEFMSMVRNARGVFGQLPPLPQGLSLEQGEYDEEKVEQWLRDEHGVMFLELDSVDWDDNLEGGEESEITGDAPSATWNDTWGEPGSSRYDMENIGGATVEDLPNDVDR